MNLRSILEKRHNQNALSCLDAGCIQNYEVGYHTKMYFCKSHKWKQEMVAYTPEGS